MSLGDKLRALIEEQNITQKDLALHLNIAPSTISSYVQNTREPDFEILRRIAKYFGVSADYLLDVDSGNSYTPAENELLRIFRSMNPEQQSIYIEQGKAFVRVAGAKNK